MTQKLFRFSKKECAEESPDNPMFQEVLLAGQLYQRFLQEKVENWLYTFKSFSAKVMKRAEAGDTLDLSEL